MKDMLDKILQIEKKYKELGETLSDPAVIQDYNKFRDLSKQRKSMEETVELYYAWKSATDAIAEAKEMIFAESDEEMKAFLSFDFVIIFLLQRSRRVTNIKFSNESIPRGFSKYLGFSGGSEVKNPPAMQEPQETQI